MKETKLNIEPELGSIPAKGTKVWYIRANMIAHKFLVIETEWIGGVSDLLRMAKGNVFFSEKEANEAESRLNSRLEKLKEITQSAEFKQKLAEEAARKKAEAEERKRKREEAMAEKQAAILDGSPSGKKKTYTLSSQERAIKYEAIKNRKKSPHPDIIV